MNNKRTQYEFYELYELTVTSTEEHAEILNFAQRYPQTEVRSMFKQADFSVFYPMYFEVTVEDDTALKLAFLMLFPQARLRTIINCAIVALG
jgi:hypothetical protein